MPVRSAKIRSAKDWEKEYLRRRGMQQRAGGASGKPHGYNPYRDAQGRFATGPHKAKEQGLKGPRRTAAAVGAFTRARRLAEAKAGMRRAASPGVAAMNNVRQRLSATAATRAGAMRAARAKQPTAAVSKPPRAAAPPAVAPQAAVAAPGRRRRRTSAEMKVARKQEAAARTERQLTRETAQRERDRARAEREASRAARRLERDRARTEREARTAARRARTEAAVSRSAAARPSSARRAIAVASKPGKAGTPSPRIEAAAKPARGAKAPAEKLGGRTVAEWNKAAIEGRWHSINGSVARSALSQLQGGGKIDPMFAHRISEYAVQLGVGRHQAEHHVHQMVLAGAARLSPNGETFRVSNPGDIPQQRFISARGIESRQYSSSGAGHFAGRSAPAAPAPSTARAGRSATKVTPIAPAEFRSAVRRLQGLSETSLATIRSSTVHSIADVARELGVTAKQAGYYVRQQSRVGALSVEHDSNGLPAFRLTNEFDLTPQKLLGTQKSSVMVAQRRAEKQGAPATERGGSRQVRPGREATTKNYEKSPTNESHPEVFGRSNARISISGGIPSRFTVEDAVHIGRQIFGNKFEEHHLASLMGAPDGSTVTVVHMRGADRGEMPRIGVRCEAPGYSSIRTFGIGHDGKAVIHNDYQVVHNTGNGMGARAFGRQVEQATRLGVDRLETHAAGSYGDRVFNGYYTWPRFGYDSRIPSHIREELNTTGPESLRGSTRLSELMDTPEGREFWRINGSDLHNAVFDLNPGSYSHQTWSNYQETRRAAGRPI